MDEDVPLDIVTMRGPMAEFVSVYSVDRADSPNTEEPDVTLVKLEPRDEYAIDKQYFALGVRSHDTLGSAPGDGREDPEIWSHGVEGCTSVLEAFETNLAVQHSKQDLLHDMVSVCSRMKAERMGEILLTSDIKLEESEMGEFEYVSAKVDHLLEDVPISKPNPRSTQVKDKLQTITLEVECKDELTIDSHIIGLQDEFDEALPCISHEAKAELRQCSPVIELQSPACPKKMTQYNKLDDCRTPSVNNLISIMKCKLNKKLQETHLVRCCESDKQRKTFVTAEQKQLHLTKEKGNISLKCETKTTDRKEKQACNRKTQRTKAFAQETKTCDKQEMRLAKQREYDRRRRAAAIVKQREQRLAREKEQIRLRRKAETKQKREKRQASDRNRQRERREALSHKVKTFKTREVRLARQRVYDKQRKETATPRKQEQRLAREKGRKRLLRKSQTLNEHEECRASDRNRKQKKRGGKIVLRTNGQMQLRNSVVV